MPIKEYLINPLNSTPSALGSEGSEFALQKVIFLIAVAMLVFVIETKRSIWSHFYGKRRNVSMQ